MINLSVNGNFYINLFLPTGGFSRIAENSSFSPAAHSYIQAEDAIRINSRKKP
jgi:hypothetical protein